ncbi:MAG: RidA family protein [Chloroflexota bacterium]
MKYTIAAPPGLARRERNGQALFSHVAIASGRRLVFVSGQVSRLEDGTATGQGDMAAQIRQVCLNIAAGLKAAGATLEDVVELTTFTTDIEEYFRHVAVRLEYFPHDPPAMTAVQVSRLSHADFLLEAKATAVLDE